MTAAEPTRFRWFRRGLLLRGLAIAAALGLLLVLTAATASTPLGMRFAGLFGGIANAIRRHPGGTALVAFASLAAVWAGLGLLAAVQAFSRRNR
jgi:hypothetical protein